MAEQIKKSDISEKDVYKFIRDSADKTLIVVDKLNKELIESAKISSKTVTKNSKLKEAKEIRAVQNEIKLSNTRMKEALKLDAEKVRITTQKMKAERLQAAEVKRTAEAQRKQTQATKTQNSEYTKLVKKTRDIKNESKRLAAQMLALESAGRKNTKEYKQLAGQYTRVTRSASKFDKILKKIDARVGDNFRSVGNYRNALGGLKNVFLQFAGGLGIARIGKSVIGTIAKFEQATANLKAVLGDLATEDNMSKLTDDARRLGSVTSFSATQVSSLQTEFAKLGFNPTAIINATGATLDLAAATGTDLAEAAKVAGGTLGGFQLAANQTGRVADVMAKSFSISALDMENFTESMKNVAPAANAVGLSVEETTALLGTLSKANITGSKAGSNLSTGFINLKAKGVELNDAFKMINNSAEPLTQAVDLVGKNAAKSFLILAKGTKTTEKLTEQLKDATGAAKDMANTQLNTLNGAVQLLNSAWEEQVLNLDEVGGVTDKLKSSIQFLANNLTTILSVLGFAIKQFILFKVVQKAANLELKLMAVNIKRSVGSFKRMRVSMRNVSRGAGKLGKALKNIGFTVVISLAIELATAFWDIASGAKQARIETERLNRINAQGASEGDKLVESSQKRMDAEKVRLKEMVLNGEITKAQMKEMLFVQKQFELELIKSTIKGANEIKNVRGQNALTISKQNALLKATIPFYTQLNDEILDHKLALIEDTEAGKKSGKSTVSTNKDIKDSFVKITPEIERSTRSYEDWVNALEAGSKKIDSQRLITETENADKAIQQRRKNIAEITLLEAELNGTEKDILDAKIVQIEENLAIALEDITLSETAKKVLILKAEKDITALKKTELAKQLKQAKEVTELITDFFIENSNKKIEQIDKEIAAAEKQQSALEELAKNGNITAQQSLKENQRIINEANKQKLKEQKRQERIKLAETVFDVYASKVAEGDKTPLVSTISDVALLRAFIDSLPSFDVGSDRLGTKGQNIDNKGGFLAINHPDEQIHTAEQNKRANYMGAEEKTKLTEAYLSGNLVSRSADGLTPGYNIDLKPLVKEMQDVKNAINNIETSSVDVQGITRSWISIVESIKKGNKITNNVHKFRKDA